MATPGWYLRLVPTNGGEILEYTLGDLLLDPSDKDNGRWPRSEPVKGGAMLGRQQTRQANTSSVSRLDSRKVDPPHVRANVQVICSPIVSRHHAQLMVGSDGIVHVLDLDSMHGTSLSVHGPLGAYMPQALHDQQVLTIGRHVNAKKEVHYPISYTVEYKTVPDKALVVTSTCAYRTFTVPNDADADNLRSTFGPKAAVPEDTPKRPSSWYRAPMSDVDGDDDAHDAEDPSTKHMPPHAPSVLSDVDSLEPLPRMSVSDLDKAPSAAAAEPSGRCGARALPALPFDASSAPPSTLMSSAVNVPAPFPATLAPQQMSTSPPSRTGPVVDAAKHMSPAVSAIGHSGRLTQSLDFSPARATYGRPLASAFASSAYATAVHEVDSDDDDPVLIENKGGDNVEVLSVADSSDTESDVAAEERSERPSLDMSEKGASEDGSQRDSASEDSDDRSVLSDDMSQLGDCSSDDDSCDHHCHSDCDSDEDEDGSSSEIEPYSPAGHVCNSPCYSIIIGLEDGDDSDSAVSTDDDAKSYASDEDSACSEPRVSLLSRLLQLDDDEGADDEDSIVEDGHTSEEEGVDYDARVSALPGLLAVDENEDATDFDDEEEADDFDEDEEIDEEDVDVEEDEGEDLGCEQGALNICVVSEAVADVVPDAVVCADLDENLTSEVYGAVCAIQALDWQPPAEQAERERSVEAGEADHEHDGHSPSPPSCTLRIRLESPAPPAATAADKGVSVVQEASPRPQSPGPWFSYASDDGASAAEDEFLAMTAQTSKIIARVEALINASEPDPAMERYAATFAAPLPAEQSPVIAVDQVTCCAVPEDDAPELVRARTPSVSSSAGPVTPPAPRKRKLDDFVAASTDAAVSTEDFAAAVSPVDALTAGLDARPIKKRRSIAGSVGLVVLGAVVGSVGTIAGLMQLAD